MYVDELPDLTRDILFFYGHQVAGECKPLIGAMQGFVPDMTVVAQAGQYYLLDTFELADVVYALKDNQPVGKGLKLETKQPVPSVEASAQVDPTMGAFVVTEHGRVVGCYTPPGQGKGVARGGPERAFGVSGGQKAANNYLQSEAPEGLIVGETGTLRLWITGEPEETGALALGLSGGEALDVRVQTVSGVEIVGSGQGRLVVPADGRDSPALKIGLRGSEAGMGRIQVFCLNRGVSLGSLTMTIAVYASEDEARDAVAREAQQKRTATLAAVAQSAPNLTLWVEEIKVKGTPAVRYQLIEAASGTSEEYEAVPLRQDPERYFSHYLAEIEEMLRNTDPAHVDDARMDVELRGEGLFEELFPEPLAETLWRRREQIESIHILSQESWIPWEMVRLFGLENGRIVSGKFFGEYRLSRWNPQFARQPNVRMKQLAVISSGGPGSADMLEEVEFLQQLPELNRYTRVSAIPAQLRAVIAALSQGDFDGLHFTGHALHHPAEALTSAIQLENQRWLYAEQLSGRLANCGIPHPLVFFNACQTAPGATGLTGLSGWAQQFMAIGAAAFLGTHWSVDGPSASQFARVFYVELMQGKTVAEAVRVARCAIRKLPSLSWLAYSVFCDPGARVI